MHFKILKNNANIVEINLSLKRAIIILYLTLYINAEQSSHLYGEVYIMFGLSAMNFVQ